MLCLSKFNLIAAHPTQLSTTALHDFTPFVKNNIVLDFELSRMMYYIDDKTGWFYVQLVLTLHHHEITWSQIIILIIIIQVKRQMILWGIAQIRQYHNRLTFLNLLWYWCVCSIPQGTKGRDVIHTTMVILQWNSLEQIPSKSSERSYQAAVLWMNI